MKIIRDSLELLPSMLARLADGAQVDRTEGPSNSAKEERELPLFSPQLFLHREHDEVLGGSCIAGEQMEA
jgi:hypothetical protein